MSNLIELEEPEGEKDKFMSKSDNYKPRSDQRIPFLLHGMEPVAV